MVDIRTPALWADVPDPDGLSIAEFCSRLPRHRSIDEARGLILYFPRTKIVGVAYDMTRGGAYVQVIRGAHGYRRQDYHLFITTIEIETAVEIPLPADIPDAPGTG